MTFFPGDFGMSKVGYDGGDSGGNEVGEPEEVVVFNDEIGEDCVKSIIKKSNSNTDEKVTGGVTAGFDVFNLVFLGLDFFSRFHEYYCST